MAEYLSSIIISAPPATVWAILTDAGAYRTWNPEIIAVDGRFARGERVMAHVRLGDGVVRKVAQRVVAFEPPSRMEWTGGLPLGLFVGRRIFTLTPVAAGTEFKLHLQMTGPLASLILKSVGDRQPEVDSFTAALKQRAERG